jgi:hypothetical protein
MGGAAGGRGRWRAAGESRERIAARRSALVLGPSVITGGRDGNVVVNPEHPDAAQIVVGAEEGVRLDLRLFGASL